MEKEIKVFSWIDSILRKNNYKTVKLGEDTSMYINQMEKTEKFEYALYQSVETCTQYILVLDVGKTDIVTLDLENKQITIYRRLLELGDGLEPEFDKNVSLLLCVNGNITEEGLEKEVLKIEEDPYCFKKFVLTYAENEISYLEKKTEKQDIWNYMQQQVKMLREGEVSIADEGIKFILKIFIKMPFLPIDIVKKQKKKDLMKKVEEELEEKYKCIWYDLINMDINKIDEIKDYTQEEIDGILDKWYGEE